MSKNVWRVTVIVEETGELVFFVDYDEGHWPGDPEVKARVLESQIRDTLQEGYESIVERLEA